VAHLLLQNVRIIVFIQFLTYFAKKILNTCIDLRDTPTLVTDNNIVRQPYLEEIIQSVLRRQNITVDAQTFIQKAQDGSLIFIFDGLDEKLVHYTKDMRQQFLAELMRVFPMINNDCR
jgi:hypothetical protein